MVAVGASIGLLASACETMPKAAAPMGVLTGKVDPRTGVRSVKAVSDNGRTYRTKVLDDGSFRFKPLPYGSYGMKFVSECESWTGDRVNLRESEHSVAGPPGTEICVVVGMAKVDNAYS